LGDDYFRERIERKLKIKVDQRVGVGGWMALLEDSAPFSGRGEL